MYFNGISFVHAHPLENLPPTSADWAVCEFVVHSVSRWCRLTGLFATDFQILQIFRFSDFQICRSLVASSDNYDEIYNLPHRCDSVASCSCRVVARVAPADVVVLVSMLKFVINLIFSFRLRIFIVPFGCRRRMIKSQLTHAFFVAVLLHIFAYHFDCLDRCLSR